MASSTGGTGSTASSSTTGVDSTAASSGSFEPETPGASTAPGSSSDSTIGESSKISCSSAAPEGATGVLSSRSVMPNPLRKRRFPSGRLPSLRRPVWRREKAASAGFVAAVAFCSVPNSSFSASCLRFSCSSSSISVFSVRWNSVETLRNSPMALPSVRAI